ncbi:MAG: DUF2225 domain-containing protein [Lachnospiraceae bacterium]|nr:DUF2225 domain-containing protein [Lachnospiraceae bacterium]
MGEGLLSGLEAFGLKDLEGMSLFEEKKPEAAAAAAAPEFTEKDFLLDKTVTCPLCEEEFKTRAVKGGKAKLIGTDQDLRSKYQELDIHKYDVIMCPFCGYTALSRFFPTLLQAQGKRIKEKITPSFKGRMDVPETYTYDEALERYKMALVNAIVKGCKASEKAFICLKSAWICRGKCEELGEQHADYAKFKAMDAEYTKNAYEGFVTAVSSESFPMCGMDEHTVNFLIGVLAYKTEHFDVASKMIATILQSNGASPRLKDKARDLKEDVLKAIAANKK